LSFRLETLIHAPKISVLVVYPQNLAVHRSDPHKTSLRWTTRFEFSSDTQCDAQKLGKENKART